MGVQNLKGSEMKGKITKGVGGVDLNGKEKLKQKNHKIISTSLLSVHSQALLASTPSDSATLAATVTHRGHAGGF